MFPPRTCSWCSCVVFVFFIVGLVAGQDSTPQVPHSDAAPTAPLASTSQRISFDDFVDSAIQQERRLTDWMRGFQPIIETYIQEEGAEYRFQKGVIRNGDDYFLGRLDLTGKSPSIVPFADEQTWNQGGERYFVHDSPPFSQVSFAQALFPDLDHFERQNYNFEFVRWESLGAVRCAAIDVKPHGNSSKRGFVGRIWVEDRNYSIVRFMGTFTSRGRAKHAFHFDSWRLNTLGDWWMPAYVYTQESKPQEPAHKLWFKAQTRVWGYGLRNAGDRRENAKQMELPTDVPDETIDPPEDKVVDRLQGAGLLAPDGDVNRILETVVNNILITNNLDSLSGFRCRVLLTVPLESFVVGRTIVLSRGLLDVLPDEATLAAVLAHELAHVILNHAVSSKYLAAFDLPFADSLIPAAVDFHYTRTQEADADKKAIELFSNSPYKDQFVSTGRFLRLLEINSARFPILLDGPFSHDLTSSHLAGMQARYTAARPAKPGRPDQISALPIGSRIVVDPWSSRIEMTKSKPVPLQSKAEKIPFEVTPFYPYLRRLEATEKAQNRVQP
jgi:hypothetical protein